jgi:hypothetical protein
MGPGGDHHQLAPVGRMEDSPMLSRIKGLRTAVCAVVLMGLSGGPLRAQASDCSETVVGAQTGQTYTLVGQVQLTVELSLPFGPVTPGYFTIPITFTIGYYQNDQTGAIAAVNCGT